MASKQRILVVDDEPNLLELVRLFLEKTKRFEVRLESRSARALAAACEFVPDMILLDIGMPGKDGGEVARELNAERATREIPILFFTSLISAKEAGERETMRGGMRFLAKPVNPKVLIESVDRVIASRRTPVPVLQGN
jgi:putative two-component system response regulator